MPLKAPEGLFRLEASQPAQMLCVEALLLLLVCVGVPGWLILFVVADWLYRGSCSTDERVAEGWSMTNGCSKSCRRCSTKRFEMAYTLFRLLLAWLWALLVSVVASWLGWWLPVVSSIDEVAEEERCCWLVEFVSVDPLILKQIIKILFRNK